MKKQKIPLPSQRKIPLNNSNAVKTNYALLLIEVNKLFKIHLNDYSISDLQLEQHCDFISDFIEANGWSIDDFIITYLCNDNINNNN